MRLPDGFGLTKRATSDSRSSAVTPSRVDFVSLCTATPRVALTRGHARQLLAEVWLPAERFDALPSVLQHGTHIKCVVALITQGINAQQTVANAVAPALVDLQELINETKRRGIL